MCKIQERAEKAAVNWWNMSRRIFSEFGDIDDEITLRFEPLQQETQAEMAMTRKTNADTGAVLIASGVISPEEERERVQADEHSGYDNLDGEIEVPDIEDQEDHALDIGLR